MKLFCYLLTIFISLNIQVSFAEPNDSEDLSSQNEIGFNSIKLNLRALLQEKQFDKLNQVLDDYQIASETNPEAERDLMTAYGAFEINISTHEALLDEWVNTTPDAYQAYIARARYHFRLATLARGTKWGSETTKEQITGMNRFFDRALSDLTKSRELNAKTILPYSTLISIANYQGEEDTITSLVRKALDISPTSHAIRARYLTTLLPRWGGSYAEMEVFIDESQTYASENPKLKWLKGLPYIDMANIQTRNGAYSRAEKLYTKALTYGEFHYFLKERGENYVRQEKYQEALQDMSRAIQLYPESREYYYWRSRAYIGLKDLNSVSADLDKLISLQLDGGYLQKEIEWLADTLILDGYNLGKKRQFDSALEYYKLAQTLTPKKASVYHRMARVYIDKNDLNSAHIELIKAIEIEPENFDYCHLMDWLLAKQQDWDQIIKYWDQYIKLVPDNSRAYVERGGAYYRKGDIRSAVSNAKIAADMGNIEGQQAYEKFSPMIK